MQFSSTTQRPNILLNQTISEKTPKNRFEGMELTAGGSYRIWNSWSKLEKKWNLQG